MVAFLLCFFDGAAFKACKRSAVRSLEKIVNLDIRCGTAIPDYDEFSNCHIIFNFESNLLTAGEQLELAAPNSIFL